MSDLLLILFRWLDDLLGWNNTQDTGYDLEMHPLSAEDFE